MTKMPRGRLDTTARNSVGAHEHGSPVVVARDSGELPASPMLYEPAALLDQCVARVQIEEHVRVRAELLRCQQELRSVSAILINVQERERMRIAADLHDGLGQSLSFIKFGLEQSLDQLRSGGLAVTVVMLETLSAQMKSAIADVRRVAMSSHPSTLDDLGILATLSWLFREFESVCTGMTLELHVDVHERDVANEQKIVIYRVIQEALNNAAKHSGASVVTVSLRRNGDWIELAISDNGCGFDRDEVNARTLASRGLGIASIRARAMSVGGTHHMSAARGDGVKIFVALPLVVGAAPTGNVRADTIKKTQSTVREIADH